VAFFFIDKGPQGHHGLSKSSSNQNLWGYYWGYSSKIELDKKHGWGYVWKACALDGMKLLFSLKPLLLIAI
jgi:hypothetical protein